MHNTQHINQINKENNVIDSDIVKEERRHFYRILYALRHYKIHSLKRLEKTIKSYDSLPLDQKVLLPDFDHKCSLIKEAIDLNYLLIMEIIKNTKNMFQNQDCHYNDNGYSKNMHLNIPSLFDMEKVESTIKQFYRDWSSEGSNERDICYKPILCDLISILGKCSVEANSETKVLVPGCGLGRLVYEVAKLGFTAQGNEWSLFMLFASNYILNNCTDIGKHKIHPWIHQYCNNLMSKEQISSINIPDIDPTHLPINSNFSMAAGDFLEIYTTPNEWDALISCFFLDTAHNVLEYLKTIYKILKPGGYFINFGPLLYHYADMPNEMSIELSYEEIRSVMIALGFIFVKEENNVATTYAQNPNSLMQYVYKCVYFVAKKQPSISDSKDFTQTHP